MVGLDCFGDLRHYIRQKLYKSSIAIPLSQLDRTKSRSGVNLSEVWLKIRGNEDQDTISSSEVRIWYAMAFLPAALIDTSSQSTMANIICIKLENDHQAQQL